MKSAEPLITMLARCERQFLFYAEQHKAKGAAGAEKAKVNLEMAMQCHNAVAEYRGDPTECQHPNVKKSDCGNLEVCVDCGQLAIPGMGLAQ